MQKMTPKHYMVIIAFSLAIASSIGLLVNIGGLFFSPMAQELNTGRGSISLTMTICNLVAALGGTLVPRVLRKENFKPVVFISALVTGGCTALLSVADSLWLIYVLNAVRGFATGFIGAVSGGMILTNWFYVNTGLVTSIALGFSGLAGALFSPLFSTIIANVGWRTSYIIVGIVMFAFYLPLILFPIGIKPEDVGTRAYGDSLSREIIADSGTQPTKKAGRKKIPVPLLMLVFAAVYAAAGGTTTAVVQHFPGVADTYALPAAIGAAMLSASMITNTSGKLLIGFLIDRIGVRISVFLYLILVASGSILLMTVHTGTAAVIAAALIGLGYSLSTVGVVMLMRTVFGMENYAFVYPKVALFNTAFYALGTALVGTIYDHTGGYTLVFIIQLIALILMGTMMMLLMARRNTVNRARN